MREMRKLLVLVGLFMFILFAVPGVVKASDADEWRWFTYFPAIDSVTKQFKVFAAEMDEVSGGNFKISVFSSGELPYKGQDVLRITRANQVQLGDTAVGFIAGELPELNIFGVPFVCTSFDEFFKSIEAVKPIIEKRIKEKTKLMVLFHWSMPSQNIWTREPLNNLGDLKGKKIRIWNPLQGTMLKALGATPVSISSNEVPTALQRGIVDGTITSALSVRDWKLYDFVKYGYMISFQMAPNVIVMNADSFNKLPEDIQDLLLNKGREWEAKMKEFSENLDARTGRELTEKGMKLIVPTKAEFEDAALKMRPMWDEWTKKNGPVAVEMMKVITQKLGKD